MNTSLPTSANSAFSCAKLAIVQVVLLGQLLFVTLSLPGQSLGQSNPDFNGNGGVSSGTSLTFGSDAPRYALGSSGTNDVFPLHRNVSPALEADEATNPDFKKALLPERTALLPAPCPTPISTLDCSQVAVSVPFELNFTGSEGGLLDNGTDGTGFRMVMHPSAPLVDAGTPADPSVPGYVPSKLDVTGGNLVINASKGLFYRTTNSGNSQINGLGVGFDASSGKYRIKTTIVNPALNLSDNNSTQAGLWFGLNEDNVVKVALVRTGTNSAKVQLQVEDYVTDGNTIAPPELNTGNISTNINSQTVTLILEIDQSSGLAQAYYQLNGGAEVLVSNVGNGVTSLTMGAHFFSSTDHDGNGGTANVSFGGVFGSLRNAPATTTIDFSFSEFAINRINALPVVANQIPDQAATVSQLFNFTVPGNTFSDPDNYPAALIISGATLANDNPLPTWLSFSNGVFSGTPGSGDLGSISVKVTASDGEADVDAFFNISVNAIPVLCPPISTLNCPEIPVTIPFSLDFAQDEAGSILDDANLGTGFTMVLEHSEARRPGDLAISNPNINGYEPSLLTLNTGT